MTIPDNEVDLDVNPTQQQNLSNELNKLNLFSSQRPSQAQQPLPPPKFADQENTDPRADFPRQAPPLFSFSQVSNQNARKTAAVSQFSQDFITPADQFDAEFDVMNCSQRHAGTLVRQRSPAAMSPMRMKRVNRMASPGPSALGPRPNPKGQIALVGPCYRSAFSDLDEEKGLMGWTERSGEGGGGSGRGRAADVVSGSRYRDEFKETGMLGQGAFCKVYSARHKLDGKTYAIKRTLRGVKRQTPEFAQFLQEVQILSNVPYHPGIIRYFTSWTETSTDAYGTEKLFIQLEAGSSTMKNLSLGDPLPEKALRAVAVQVLEALDHLHGCGIAHMDIKPSNILIVRGPGRETIDETDMMDFADGEIKLGDFGLATACRPLKGSGTQELTVQEGDACYLPLEVMNSSYTQLDKADVFALGATLFELASGNELPSGGQLYEDLRREKVPLLPNLTTSMMQTIRMMMRFDPSQRPSASQVLLRLRRHGSGGAASAGGDGSAAMSR